MMKTHKHAIMRRCLALFMAFLLGVSLFPSAALTALAAEDGDETGYVLDVNVTPADASVDLESLQPGDSVTLTANLTYDGTTITDLEEAGLYLWWWTDSWNDHEGYNSDASYSDYDNNSGRSLTATVTFPSEGDYCIVAELQDSEGSAVTDEAGNALTIHTEFIVAVATSDDAVESDIEVQKVSNLSDDFIMGMDISTIVAEYASGVQYYDFEGNELETVTDFCTFLAEDCGVTSVRVRVWNDPYDEEDHGYGAGNCDVANAVTIAEACYAAGLTMLVDFHYSDFWADPNRQLAPKAWTDYTVEEKADALYTFTLESLDTIAATGVTISMVQVGNETSNAVAGISYSSIESMCILFSSGSKAVRTFSEATYGDEKAVKIAIHVANPNNQEMTYWAGNLETYGVDYDVMATSYYAFWHGTYENLKNQMQSVIEDYGKEVLVAETSYVYTDQDTDGQGNSVVGDTDLGSDEVYEASVQGQANAVRDVIAAVSEVGGIGVYYWEPAWITVGDITGLEGDELTAQISENQEIWETYGSGWASSYAYSYDPYSADYGGSEWDNQALFGADGHPLTSLNVYNYVKTGSYTNTLYVSSVESPVLNYILGEGTTLQLPTTVDVTYSKASIGTIAESVTWNADDVEAVDLGKAVTYTVNGTATLSQKCTDGTTEVAVTLTVVVKEPNLITDSDAAGFETSDGFTISGSGITLPSTENVLDGNYAAHWWNGGDEAITSTISYNYGTLAAGYYTLEMKGMGAEGDGVTLLVQGEAESESGEGMTTEEATGDEVMVAAENTEEESSGVTTIATGETTILNGWFADAAFWSDASVTFCLEKDMNVTFVIQIDMLSGGWGSVDSMYLRQHANPVYEGNGDDTHEVTCGDCEMLLATQETCAYDDGVITTKATCTGTGVKTYTCQKCGESYTEMIAATGHDYQYADNHDGATHTVTCSQCDYNATEDHNFVDGNCTLCGAEEVEVHVHTYGEPVFTWTEDNEGCEAAFTCTANDDTQVVTCFVTANTTKEATCTEEGTIIYTASCTFNAETYKESKTVTISAKGHETELKNVKEATCTKAGYTGDAICKICGATVEKGVVIPATGHSYQYADNGDGKTHTVTCKNCDLYKTENHTYKNGKCTKCGAKKAETIKLSAPTSVKLINAANGIKITWKSVSGAEGYYIYRSVNGGSYKKIATTDECKYKDKSVKNGKLYSYKIYAYSGETVSKASSTKRILYLAIPTICHLSNLKGNKLNINWKKNANATGYQIQYSTNSDFSNAKTVTVTGSNLSKTVSKLKANKKYYVRIRSYCKYGNTKYYSAWSNKDSVKIKK